LEPKREERKRKNPGGPELKKNKGQYHVRCDGEGKEGKKNEREGTFLKEKSQVCTPLIGKGNSGQRTTHHGAGAKKKKSEREDFRPVKKGNVGRGINSILHPNCETRAARRMAHANLRADVKKAGGHEGRGVAFIRL